MFYSIADNRDSSLSFPFPPSPHISDAERTLRNRLNLVKSNKELLSYHHLCVRGRVQPSRQTRVVVLPHSNFVLISYAKSDLKSKTDRQNSHTEP